ncbi:hypothetical protein D3C86_1879970 [compost metagenome]
MVLRPLWISDEIHPTCARAFFLDRRSLVSNPDTLVPENDRYGHGYRRILRCVFLDHERDGGPGVHDADDVDRSVGRRQRVFVCTLRVALGLRITRPCLRVERRRAARLRRGGLGHCSLGNHIVLALSHRHTAVRR